MNNYEQLSIKIKQTIIDNAPQGAVYYADGTYFDKHFMWYQTHWIYCSSWIQSGFTEVSQLKKFKDFLEIVND
jgi:hypothetical protein